MIEFRLSLLLFYIFNALIMCIIDRSNFVSEVSNSNLKQCSDLDLQPSYLQLSDFVSVVSWKWHTWCVLFWLYTAEHAFTGATVKITTFSFKNEPAKAKDETCNEWRGELQFTPQAQTLDFFWITHSISTSHPVLWWVFIKPKSREGRSAGLRVQREWEGCRLGGRTLPEWGSARTEAETATWQQRVFRSRLTADLKLSNFHSPDLNENVGVEVPVAGEAWGSLSCDGDWGQTLCALLCCLLCGCSSTAASPSSISASSMSSTSDGCSWMENTRSVNPFQTEWPLRTRTNVIHNISKLVPRT